MDPLNEQKPPIIPPTTPYAPETDDYNPQHKVHVAPVRSFSSDLANAIRDKGGSVVRIAIAEDEKHRREFQETSATSRKNIAFIIAAMVIVIGALGTVVWVYSHEKTINQPAAVTTPAVPTSIVSAENYQTLDFTGMKPTDAITAINTAVANAVVPDGTVMNLVVTANNGGTVTRIPATQFLSTLGMNVPEDLSQALSPQYMLGIYNDGTNSPFIIVQGTAHDYLLSGMLEWEPKLFSDMVPIFNIDTSSLTKAQLQSVPFTDMVIENRDTRAALDASGKPLFFYSFLDDDTIIFATDSKTLTEVVRRY